MKAYQAIALSALILFACGRSNDDPSEGTAPTGTISAEVAKPMIGKLASTLMGELQTAVTEKGPVEAISICSERAPQMAKLAATDGYRIRRIGTRPRNTKTNTPTAAEWKVLQGLTAENPVFQGPIDGREVYMQAQFIPSPLCLTCHGNGDQIPKEVTEALAKLYPDDQATGYALGDLRGALIVERTR